MTIDQEKIKALGELYGTTEMEWFLTVSHCLTEPTCPSAIVHPEGSDHVRYRADRDTIEDAINAAVDMCYREQILKEHINPECPWDNPDDRNNPLDKDVT